MQYQILGAGILAVCAVVPVTFAQAEVDEATSSIPVVLVTAQKIQQDQREVPISITVLDGDKLSRAKLDTTDEISQYAANAHFTRNVLVIRGVGTVGTAGNLGLESSVGVFIDGVYLGRATAALTPLFDIDQVEIARGPQSAVLGKNTIGGALLLTTRTASPDESASGTTEVLYGSLLERSYKAALSIPWHSEWALRLAVLDDRRDGDVFNSSTEQTESARTIRGVRAKLTWQPGAAFSAWISAEMGVQSTDGFGEQLTSTNATTLQLFRLYDPATEADRSDFHTATDARNSYQRRHGNSTTLNASYKTDAVTITSLSNLAHARYGFFLDADFTPIPLITLRTDEAYRQWSQELRINGRWQSVDYIAGAYYLNANLGIHNLLTVFPNGATGLALGASAIPDALSQALHQATPALSQEDLVSDQSLTALQQTQHSGALFGQAIWSLTERWSLTGSLRWDQEQKRAHVSQSFERSGAAFIALLGDQPYDEHPGRNETSWSPRLALQYAWTPNLNLYTSTARGYKSGGFSDFAPTADTLAFKPEHSTSIEAGMKALLFTEHLALNLSVFDTDYQNLQISNFDGTQFTTQNAAAARIDGIEIETRWQLTHSWSIATSAGYLDARYISYKNAPPQANSDGLPGVPQPPQDLTGKSLAFAPRWSGTLGVEYVSAPLTHDLILRMEADAFYRSRAFLNVDLDPIDSQPMYWQFNAALRVSAIGSAWSVGLVGKNLSNRIILNESADLPLFPGDHWGRVDPARNWAVSIQWNP